MESTLYLMKDVDLDPNYNYTIDFDTPQAQSAYFDDKISEALEVNENYSQIKFNEPIKVYQNIDELFGVNYLRFENNNKTYYAFILNKKWVSDECTALEFKIDVMQSFMFDYEIDETFIEREHQDKFNKLTPTQLSPIYNRENEQLDKGNNYFCKVIEQIKEDIPSELKNDFATMLDNGRMQIFWAYIVASEPLSNELFNIADSPVTAGVAINKGMVTNTYAYVAPIITIQGTYGGSKIISFSLKLKEDATNGVAVLNSNDLIELSSNTNVISINVSRYSPFEYSIAVTETSTTKNYAIIPVTPSEWFSGIYIAKGVGLAFQYFNKDLFKNLPITSHNYIRNALNYKIDNLKSISYEPKLETQEFKYYELSYGNQNIKLNIEDFRASNHAEFKFISSFSIKNGQAILPLDYKGMDEAFTDMATFDSITNELPLRTDAWKEYLAQHKNSLITGFKTGAMQTAGSALLGVFSGGLGLVAGASMALNYAGQVANQMAQIKDIKETPDKVEKTTIDTTLDYAIDDIYIKLNTYEIHDNFKNKIFNYLFHYGYKCNDFKKPNVRSRYYFNYIKTIGANIKTNIDADYKAEIMRIYDAGITIWHYRDKNTFKGVNNYDYENVEMNLIGGTNG